jgi:ArsR family transcriptional regulator
LRLFKALADETRLRILRLLSERSLCVCELTDILGLEQSRMSHQLKLLRDAGLVEDLRIGRWIIYRIPKARREIIVSLLQTAAREDPDRVETHRRVLSDLERCRKKNLRRIKSCPPGNQIETMPAVPGKAKSSPSGLSGRRERHPDKENL